MERLSVTVTDVDSHRLRRLIDDPPSSERQEVRSLESLEEHGVALDTLRIRAFPFQAEVADFVKRHEKVFVVEQNRDGQLRTLLVAEAGIDPSKLISILHYDGTPITARFIIREIAGRLAALNVAPFRKAVS